MEKNRCAGCKYYRPECSASTKGHRMCHYLLDNKRRRERDGDECLSYEPKRKSEFPARLRKLREERRQSRVVVSELCGLDRGAVRYYERGERSPTLEALVALADYFEVSLDYLTGRTNFR